MRKQLKLLLLVVTVLALFVTAMIVGSAEEEGSVVSVTTGAELEALLSSTAEPGQIIRLENDVIVQPLLISKRVTLDGNGYTITLNPNVKTGAMVTIKNVVTIKNAKLVHSLNDGTNTESLFSVQSAVDVVIEDVVADNTALFFNFDGGAYGSNVLVKNCDLKTSTTLRVISMSKKYAPESMTFDNCKLTALNGTGFKMEGLNANTPESTYTFNGCTVNAGKYFLYNDTNPAIFNVTGKNVVNAPVFSYVRSPGSVVNVGEVGGDDSDIVISCTTGVVNTYGGHPVKFTLNSGTFVALEGNVFHIESTFDSIEINGGTYVANAGTSIFGGPLTDLSGKIKINKGNFKLDGGGTFIGGEIKEQAYVLPEAAAPGDVKVYLGAGSADNEDIQKFFKKSAWGKANTHFYIFGWSGTGAGAFEFTQTPENPLTLDEVKAMVEEFVQTTQRETYEALTNDEGAQAFFTSGDNQNLFILSSTLPAFVVKNNAVVTITGGVYTTDGMFAILESGELILKGSEISIDATFVQIKGGKLTLEDCKITGTSEDALIVLGGTGASLEIKGDNGAIQATAAAVVSIESADCGTVTVNGGTFTSNTRNAIFSSTVNGVTGKINIQKGVFNLSGGATLAGGTLANTAFTLPTESTSGAIKVVMGAGTADDADVQAFFNTAAWSVAGAHFYVTGWGAGNASTYEFKQNFTGTLEEYKQMLKDYIPTAPGLTYGALSNSIFVEDQNLFVQIPEEELPEMLPFTIKDSNVVVTLNGWDYTAEAMLAVIRGGKLVLADCNITANVPTGAFLYVEGEGAIIEVTSGAYTSDMQCFFGVESGTLKLSGGNFVNTKGDLIHLTGAANVEFAPTTAETVLDVTVKGKLIYAYGASNSTVSIKGGRFVASEIDTKNTQTNALIVYDTSAGAITGATLTVDNGYFEATRMLVANDVGVTITVNNGTFASNYVLSASLTLRPENAHMFILGGANAKLTIHGGSFDNKGGNYLFAFADVAGAEVVIDGGAFNGAGWAYMLQSGKFTVKANADTTKNPVFTDTDGLALGNYFHINNANATVTLNAGTYTAGTNEYYVFGVLKGKLYPRGGSYEGSMFYVTKDSRFMVLNSTFNVAGSDAVLFYIEGTGITKTQLNISNGNTFNVSKGACIFDTTLNAATVKALFTGTRPLSKVVVSDYAKMSVTISGAKTFASNADVITLIKTYFPTGAIEFNTGAACALKVYGNAQIAVTGGNWNYAGDYLFTLAGGGSFTVSGGTFNVTGGGLVRVIDKAVNITIGNTQNTALAPTFTIVDGLGFITNEAEGTNIVIENGTVEANDFLDFHIFELLSKKTEVVVNGGNFAISVGSRYDSNKLQNDSVIFYMAQYKLNGESKNDGVANLTINDGSFTAARIFCYYAAAGTLNIYDGEFTSNAYCYNAAYMIHLRHKQNTLNIYGGTFTANKYNPGIMYTQSGVGSGTNMMNINIYSGRFNKGLHWLTMSYKCDVTIDKLVDEDGNLVKPVPVFNGLSDGAGSNYGSNVTPHGFYTGSNCAGAAIEIKAGEFRCPSPQNFPIFTLGSGNVTIYDGVVIESAYYIFQMANAAMKTNYTIKGGHFIATDAGNLIELSAAAGENQNLMLIEGGTFEARDNATLFSIIGLGSNNTILVKGGTFSSADARLAFFEEDTAANFIIEGGTFTTAAARMFYVDSNATPFIIKGGTFILEERSGNNADSGIIYAVGKNPSKVSIQGGTFIDERSRSNQTFIKMNPKAVVEFAGPFKLYVANEKKNFYYDNDNDSNSIPFVQWKETYNEKEYYVCFGYYNQYAPTVYNTPVLRPVAGAEGLTFTASVSAEAAAHLATLGTVSYGTLIFPTKYLPDGWQNGTDFLAELKAYAQETGKSENSVYAMVNAVNGVVYAEDGSFTIRASIINIKEQNYTLDLTGIAYAKVTAADGTETYYYASHVSAGVSTNMRATVKYALIEDISTKAIADGSRVYCYTAIMKKDRFSRYDMRFQDSLRKYLAESDRAPKW